MVFDYLATCFVSYLLPYVSMRVSSASTVGVEANLCFSTKAFCWYAFTFALAACVGSEVVIDEQ